MPDKKLATARPPVPEQRLELEDSVPKLREDLVVSIHNSPDGQRLVRIRSPQSAHPHDIYDFELTLARMFDGKRKAKNIL